jgi:hypothetical protein
VESPQFERDVAVAELSGWAKRLFENLTQIRMAAILPTRLAMAILVLASSAAAQSATTYTVTLAGDTNSTDSNSSDPIYNIPGLGMGEQDTNDATGNSGDLRYVIQRAITNGGNINIVFSSSMTGCTPTSS